MTEQHFELPKKPMTNDEHYELLKKILREWAEAHPRKDKQ